MPIKLNENLRLGNVIYIVEGDKTEKIILQSIFCDLLGYNVTYYDKHNGEVQVFKKHDDRYSNIYVVPYKNPAIVSLEKEEDYLDEIYKKLKTFGLNAKHASRYFIFDRDRKSNRPAVIRRLFKKLYSSTDSEGELNGLLLLSYPSIEAFILHAYEDRNKFSDGKSIKKYVEDRLYSVSLTSKEQIIKAFLAMTFAFSFLTGR